MREYAQLMDEFCKKSSCFFPSLCSAFKKEEIRVQIDNAGKLLVKGSRQASENKVLVVDQSFDVPKDSIVEMISGGFEDGRLTVFMPRKVVKEQEAIQKATAEEKGKAEKREEESVQKEAKTSEERKVEPTKEKNELTRKEKPKSVEDDKDQEPQKKKPKTEGEKKDDSPVLEEKQQTGVEKKDEAAGKEKPESVEERKKEDSTQTENTRTSAVQRVKDEKTNEKMKQKIKEICADKQKEIQKKKTDQGGVEGSRLDSGSLDGMLEKLNRNKNVIAVAVVAFFVVAFSVSHKLRTGRR